MVRYNPNKLPYPKQEQLLDVFCETVCKLRTKAAIRNFLKDLLNRQERLMLIRRLLIAELLLEGKTYREIQDQLRVGPATVARIDRWLHFGRNGYKQAIRVKNK